MTIRKILVPLTGIEPDRVALDAAFSVAGRFRAHVDGLFVRPDPRDAIPLVGEGMSGALIEDIMRTAEMEANARGTEAERMFTAAVESAAAETADAPPVEEKLTARYRTTVGRVDALAHEGHLTDLLVFGPAIHDIDTHTYAVMETALMQSGRPLLIAPPHLPAGIGDVVSIAWNDSREAARSVAASMPFLRRAKVVHVLVAETGESETSAGQRLCDYLAWHRVEADLNVIHVAGEPLGGALLARSAEMEANLVVMGGYGHSRLWEMMVGGVTRYVLDHAGLPVLIEH